jgi:hypothetical protein
MFFRSGVSSITLSLVRCSRNHIPACYGFETGSGSTSEPIQIGLQRFATANTSGNLAP